MAYQAVLLVEDDPNDALLVQAALKRAQISQPCITLKNAEQAIGYLGTLEKPAALTAPPAPLLVLLSLRLPGMDGFSLLEWLREHPVIRHRLTLLVLSGFEAPPRIERAYHLGAQSYLVKPLRFEHLVALLRDIKEHWLDSDCQVPALKIRCSKNLRCELAKKDVTLCWTMAGPPSEAQVAALLEGSEACISADLGLGPCPAAGGATGHRDYSACPHFSEAHRQ